MININTFEVLASQKIRIGFKHSLKLLTAEGAGLKQYSPGRPGQSWVIVACQGYFVIFKAGSKKCITVGGVHDFVGLSDKCLEPMAPSEPPDSQARNAAQRAQRQYEQELAKFNAQLWSIESVDPAGYFRIESKTRHQVLDAYHRSVDDGVKIVGWDWDRRDANHQKLLLFGERDFSVQFNASIDTLNLTHMDQIRNTIGSVIGASSGDQLPQLEDIRQVAAGSTLLSRGNPHIAQETTALFRNGPPAGPLPDRPGSEQSPMRYLGEYSELDIQQNLHQYGFG